MVYGCFDDYRIVPQYSEVESRKDCDTTSRLTRNYSLGVPVVGAPMATVCGGRMLKALDDLGAIGCSHRFQTIEQQKQDLNVIAPSPRIITVGVTGDYKERLAELSRGYGFLIALLDVAHGDHILVKKAIRYIHDTYPWMDIIAGNVCTYEGALRLQDWGADAVRVGVASGSACLTAINTGAGLPLMESLLQLGELEIPIMADGGIRTGGDVAKALGAGASTVMLGSLLAGCDESPGEIVELNGKKMKPYHGSASKVSKGTNEFVEGASGYIESTGPVSQVLSGLMHGLRSAMSYSGSRTIPEYQSKVQFQRVSSASIREAHAHAFI